MRKYLASNSNHNNHHNYQENSHSHIPTPSSPVINLNTNSSLPRGHRISSSDSLACRKTSKIPVNSSRIPSLSAPQSPQTLKPIRYQSHIPTANGSVPSPKKQHTPPPRFEAYMMTGDLILNLSRTSQNSDLLPAAQVKKPTIVDSLRDSPARNLKRKNGNAPRANYDSSPSESSSPSISELAYDDNNSNNGEYRSCIENESNSRRASKLSKMHLANSDSLDEEEEHLIMEPNNDDDHNPSSIATAITNDERKTKKYNLSNIGCANNTSSSSSTSSSTNTNSTNSSDNHHRNNNNNNSYDGGGDDCKNKNNENVVYVQEKNLKYSMFLNEDGGQSQSKQTVLQEKSLEVRTVTSSASMSSTTTTSSASTTINRSETLLTPTLDVSHSMPASPTSYSSTPLLEAPGKGKRRELNSVPTSPECSNQQQQQQQQEILVVRRNSSNTHTQQNGVSTSSSSSYRKCDAVGSCFRTSRSEDHLQHSQRDGAMGNAIPIDIDEDINSSLNTLLDTRHDSEDSQVSTFFKKKLLNNNKINKIETKDINVVQAKQFHKSHLSHLIIFKSTCLFDNPPSSFL